jgi:uncharacterized Zn finger protein (UPF0148 family)
MQSCPHCQFSEIAEGLRFCPNCGNKLGEIEAPPAKSPPARMQVKQRWKE